MDYAALSRNRVQGARRSDPPGDFRTALSRWRADRVDAHRPIRRVATGGLQASRRPETVRAGARSPRRPANPLPRRAARPRAADRLDERLRRVLARPLRQARKPAQENGPMTETLSVVVERELPFPPEKLWRALTQPHLIEEWLMQNDFKPVVGHQFQLRRDPQPNWN